MTARTHDVAAFTALGAVVLIRPLPSLTLATVLVSLLANQIGGIVPDIDQPTAPFWRNLPIGRLFGKVFDRLMGGHRFLSHSIIGVAIFSGLAFLLLHFLSPIMPHVDVTLVLYSFMIGMVSHLVMDTFTKEGVPWLLPLPMKFGLPPVRTWRITTGGVIEKLVIFPAFLALDIWFCTSHYSQLLAYIHQHLIY